MKKLDLYVAAMGRSGSTLLCDLYSQYPSRWLMNEPWIIRGSYGEGQLKRIRRFGFQINDEDWHRKVDGESNIERFYRVYADILNRLEFFGAKEVRYEFHEEYYRLMQPRKVLILVRDIRDVIISLLEKTEIQKIDGYDTDFVVQYLKNNCCGLIDFHTSIQGAEVEILKYEDFTQSEIRQKQIDRFIGCERSEKIPENNNISEARPWEIERHGLHISSKTVYRYKTEKNRKWVDLYSDIKECRTFNEFFGYE